MDRQVREGRVRERRGRVEEGNGKELHSVFFLPNSWFKLRLPEAGLGLARMSWSPSWCLCQPAVELHGVKGL